MDSVDDLVDTIPGVPGEDYPIYSTVNLETRTNLKKYQIYFYRSPTPPLTAEDDLTEATMETPRLTVKPSTSAPVMEQED